MERLWALARRYRGRFVWGGLMLVLTNAAAMAVPQLFRYAINGIQTGESQLSLQTIALTLVLVALGGAVFRTLSRVHIFYAARDVELDLRCALYRHLSTLEPAYFQRHPVGDLMSRATNDLTQVRLMLGPGILNIINTALTYAAAIPLMALISPSLTIITLLVYPPAFWLMRHVARLMYQRTREQQQALGKFSDYIQESLAGAHVIRSFASEEERKRGLEVLNEAYYRTNVRLNVIRSTMFRLVLTLGNLGILLAVFVGAVWTIRGELLIGDLVALVEYMALLSWPTFALGWVLSIWQRGRASLSRLAEVLEQKPAITSGPLSPTQLVPSIEARQLSVRYDHEPVLTNIALSVAPGRVLGVVGPIGGGKTTLVSALMRLVDVAPKQLFVGGYDVTELDLDVLRAVFGYVPQGHFLFSKSLRENVAFGSPHSDEASIREVLEMAAFDTDLASLPQGLETPVGERGITLSGGQKQRVSIARALLLDPPILLLDDALSSVDAETEARILERLQKLREGRTTVIVAHRVSAVQKADEIIVLDRGRITERGRHAELIERGGWYAEMARRQELERDLDAAPSRKTSVA